MCASPFLRLSGSRRSFGCRWDCGTRTRYLTYFARQFASCWERRRLILSAPTPRNKPATNTTSSSSTHTAARADPHRKFPALRYLVASTPSGASTGSLPPLPVGTTPLPSQPKGGRGKVEVSRLFIQKRAGLFSPARSYKPTTAIGVDTLF